jgi:predicted nucleic acid-binding protein
MVEIGVRGAADPAVIAVRAAPWIQVVPDPIIPQQILGWGLDAGESAVLALSLEQQASQAVLDDLAARRCATSLGIATQGTLGMLLVAKQSGMIPEVRPLIHALRQAGFYMSDKLVQRVLRAAGE